LRKERGFEKRKLYRKFGTASQYYLVAVVSAAVVSAGAEVVVVSAAGAGVPTVTVSWFSAFSFFSPPHEVAIATTKAATNNLTVFFIDFGLKFPFIQKGNAGNPILEKYLPWVTFTYHLY
jgi:hypothetical protein